MNIVTSEDTAVDVGETRRVGMTRMRDRPNAGEESPLKLGPELEGIRPAAKAISGPHDLFIRRVVA